MILEKCPCSLNTYPASCCLQWCEILYFHERTESGHTFPLIPRLRTFKSMVSKSLDNSKNTTVTVSLYRKQKWFSVYKSIYILIRLATASSKIFVNMLNCMNWLTLFIHVYRLTNEEFDLNHVKLIIRTLKTYYGMRLRELAKL